MSFSCRVSKGRWLRAITVNTFLFLGRTCEAACELHAGQLDWLADWRRCQSGVEVAMKEGRWAGASGPTPESPISISGLQRRRYKTPVGTLSSHKRHKMLWNIMICPEKSRFVPNMANSWGDVSDSVRASRTALVPPDVGQLAPASEEP